MMLLGSYPRLLVLALSLPEVSHALGLGSLHVESRLNEPLSAQIDIVGATPDELKAMKASVASPEVFQRYSTERPAFLSTAAITVGADASGKPVLNIRSTDAFTEPLVEFLIDVRWGQQELVRDYSLLLDPAQSAPAISTSGSAAANEAPSSPVQTPMAEIQALAPPSTALSALAPVRIVLGADPAAVRTEMQYRVVAHDTLRSIVRHAGARSESEQQRMMWAIFQANRNSFAGNINRLYSGALIQIPSTAQIQVFDRAEVAREIRNQMTAWREAGQPVAPTPAAPPVIVQSAPIVARAPALRITDRPEVLSTIDTLDGRVQFLQQSLDETNRQVAVMAARITMERNAAPSALRPATVVASRAKPVKIGGSSSSMLWGLALLLGGLAYACRRFLSGRSRRPLRAEAPTAEARVLDTISLRALPSSAGAADASPESHDGRGHGRPESTDDGATVELAQVADIDVHAGDSERGDEPDTVALETLEPQGSDAVGTMLDYDLSNLDGRAQHVEMPGSLHEHVVVVERRKNIVDTLMAALQRDPTRSDLRMKLLETLYSTAATNLRAFKEVVRDLANHPERLQAGEWQQVMAMGRQIAADDPLFADPSADHTVADCA